MFAVRILIAALFMGCITCEAFAETPDDREAKVAFGTVKTAPSLPPKVIGGFAFGCLAGAKQLATDGLGWQTMRPSRNRAWGHPLLVAMIEKLATDTNKLDGVTGLLVGDMSQPLGGPMLTGHASHQIGLDADIWLKPMPTRQLTVQEREALSADNMVDEERLVIDASVFGEDQVKIIRRAASYPEVARIFVHPAIKKALCDNASKDRGWLHKVRPWWQHNYHFHVRLTCPKGDAACVDQAPVGTDEGCTTELDDWFKKIRDAKRKPMPPAPPAKPLMVSAMPKECQALVQSKS